MKKILLVLAAASLFAGNVLSKQCSVKKSNSKLICYYSEVIDVDFCLCSHVILPANSDSKAIDAIREKFQGVKVLLTVNEFNEVSKLKHFHGAQLIMF